MRILQCLDRQSWGLSVQPSGQIPNDISKCCRPLVAQRGLRTVCTWWWLVIPPVTPSPDPLTTFQQLLGASGPPGRPSAGARSLFSGSRPRLCPWSKLSAGRVRMCPLCLCPWSSPPSLRCSTSPMPRSRLRRVCRGVCYEAGPGSSLCTFSVASSTTQPPTHCRSSPSVLKTHALVT